ncbi:MAG: ribonuclease Y [Armatimonadetes bacterium]|nr:ribonuclease Y [Armatimonadota bacterium]
MIAFAVGFALGRFNEKRRLEELHQTADNILDKARQESEALKAKELLAAQQEIRQFQLEAEKESNERRKELRDLERRVAQREENLERKQAQLERKEERQDSREQELGRIRSELDQTRDVLKSRLEEAARLSADQARDELFAQVERQNELAIARRIRQAEETAKEEADRRARRIITTAVQKWSSDQVVESTVSVVNLPTDEMKGRIIGREGRNIRMLESMTGVDLIIDDTPEAVILSGFDPIRREVARMALEKLVADGRIHPARIEEMVEKSRKEMDDRIVQEGEKAALEAGATGLHSELVKLLGRLRFRTSYGQNVLYHSLEVSFLCAQMAAEVGGEVEVARRAGLLHDIGKAVSSEMEGPHAVVGARLCQKYGESPEVVHCVEAHHEDVEQRTIEAMLLQAADAISAARPGARRENVETYIKRLEKLEVLANSFRGVEQTYAIQAGREIRVIVRPELVDDLAATRLAREVANKIEQELQYPGQIKVTVIREMRSFDYAR